MQASLARPLTGGAVRAALLTALDDPRRAVRLSDLGSLINVGGEPFTTEDERRFRRVSREFAAKASLYQDDATVLGDLGVVQLLAGEFDLAATAMVNSRTLEPNRPSTTFMLALARLGQRRVDEARALLKQVPSSDPYYRSAQQRLKELER